MESPGDDSPVYLEKVIFSLFHIQKKAKLSEPEISCHAPSKAALGLGWTNT